jgi:hypothetical protein
MRAHAGRTAWRPCAHQWRLGPINCEALGKQHMGDTYNSAAEAEADRAQQLTLLEARSARQITAIAAEAAEILRAKKVSP